MYHLLGASLALALLLIINAAASLLTAGLWRVCARPARRWSATTRAQIIFALRIFPAASALGCVSLLMIPAYIAHEPVTTTEVVSFKLAALALLSMTGITLALWRSLVARRATLQLAADWMQHSEAVTLEGISIPAYRIRHAFPVIAVVGFIRPRLFIASQVFDTLTPEELSAALAHESAHLASYDNLKRGLLRACRDSLTILPCGRSLDRAWVEASEAAADERAARAGASLAINLASTLVKIARMAPLGASAKMPAGAFLVDEMRDGVAGRVRQLTRLAGTKGADERRQPASLNLGLLIFPGALIVATASTAASARILAITHAITESIVHALS